MFVERSLCNSQSSHGWSGTLTRAYSRWPLKRCGGFKEMGLRLVQECGAWHPRPKAAWRGPPPVRERHSFLSTLAQLVRKELPSLSPTPPALGSEVLQGGGKFLQSHHWVRAVGAERGSTSAPPPGSLQIPPLLLQP